MQSGLQPKLPTLVLAECVLVYMQPADSTQLMQQLGNLLPTAACVVYEQIRPDDAFGQQMLMNLEVRSPNFLRSWRVLEYPPNSPR